MTPEQMHQLIEQHITAENAGDTKGAVAVYSPDVVHDVVGSPMGPLVGPAAAQGFYEYLSATLADTEMVEQSAWYGENFCVLEHLCTTTVVGEFLGVPGAGRRIDFRMMHLWEFKEGAMSRENVWLDGGSILGKLTGALPALG